jgi:NAD-dependent deacetylase
MNLNKVGKMTDIELLAQLIQKSNITTIFTGAGISTESGLPDYRSSNGLWNKNQIDVATTNVLNENFERFIDIYRDQIIRLQQYKPNIGHEILAKWQKDGLVDAIITQNVDGFHQMAGSNNVIELHGTLTKQRCLGCRKEYENINEIESNCLKCSGRLRPCVVFYGESLPKTAIEKAVFETNRCNLFISIGSSLQVSPANILPLKAKQSGAKLCIINNEETIMDSNADLIVRGNISTVLQSVNESLKNYYHETSPMI